MNYEANLARGLVEELLNETADQDIQNILKNYLAWQLSPPPVFAEAGKYKYVEKP